MRQLAVIRKVTGRQRHRLFDRSGEGLSRHACQGHHDRPELGEAQASQRGVEAKNERQTATKRTSREILEYLKRGDRKSVV